MLMPEAALCGMSTHLTIPTDDIQVAFDLISLDHSLRPGATVTTPGGATLRFERLNEGPGQRGSLDFDLSGGGTGQEPVEIEPLAEWLHARLQGRVESVRLGGQTVAVEPEALKRALGRELVHF